MGRDRSFHGAARRGSDTKMVGVRGIGGGKTAKPASTLRGASRGGMWGKPEKVPSSGFAGLLFGPVKPPKSSRGSLGQKPAGSGRMGKPGGQGGGSIGKFFFGNWW